MKKKVLLCVSIAAMLSLTACSNGVSQKDYDKLINEKEKIESDYSTLEKEYEELNKKYLEDKDNNLKTTSDNFTLSKVNAWAQTSFGDSASCSLDDKKHLTVHVPSNYTASNVPEILSNIKNSLSTWVAIDSPTSNTTEFNYITITFYDNSQDGIISYTFDNSNKEFELKTIMGNLQKVEEIVNAIPKN
ncbi:MAG: hypothetical protein LBS02_10540 [Hungatella sp.]|nr:hypothetical protein [Hungatella sp.]